MLTMSTAKALLFIALTLNPSHPEAIYATSTSESYVITPSSSGWDVTALGFPSADFPSNPSTSAEISSTPTRSDVSPELAAISKIDWEGNGVAVLPDGDRIEKHGKNAFYIVNAGAPNQKVFTIYYHYAK